jgi:hypothetical protein
MSAKLARDNIKDIIVKYESGVNARILARQYSTDSSTVHKLLRANGAKKKLIKHQSTLIQFKNEIIKSYNDSINVNIIAKQYNVPVLSLVTFLKNNTNYKVANRNFNAIPEQDKEKLYKLHHHDLLPLKQIAKLYNCSAPTVASFFDKHLISRRSKYEAVLLTNYNIDTALRRLKNLHKIKEYVLPSSKIVKLKGYEPYFLDYVFKNNILREEEIVYIPQRIKYIQNNKIRHYYPDFYIPKLNLIVEIKSKYILNLQTKENVSLKELATKTAGFNYCIVLDNDFTTFNKYFNI